jgi:hypothetical protein
MKSTAKENSMFNKFRNLTLLALVPLLTGCGGGGAALLGSLFSSVASGGGAGSGFSPFGFTSTIASVHNPEPASLLLMGGGMTALAYFRKKKA